MTHPLPESEVGEALAWPLLLAARQFVDVRNAEQFPNGGRRIAQAVRPSTFLLDPETGVVDCRAGLDARADLCWCGDGWQVGEHLPAPVRHFLAFYLPVLGDPLDRHRVIGHLGQSVDSRIATVDGDAFYVTGEENRRHLHRLRALCHAVIVGAGTAVIDDPQLTTRAVAGSNPVRIIIDPQARVRQDLAMLHDGSAPVCLLHAASVDIERQPVISGVRRMSVPEVDGALRPVDILAALADQGMYRVFVEGGGITVSRFLEAGCLDRLQIAVAPLLVGDGTPAIRLPAAPSMQQALRPDYRVYRMGEDVLWDFTLKRGNEDGETPSCADKAGRLQAETAFERLF